MIYAICRITLYSGTRRSIPIRSGYRPIFDFPNQSSTASGKIELINRDDIAPGGTEIVTIWLLDEFINFDRLTVGTKFTFAEGALLLGEGEVLKVERE